MIMSGRASTSAPTDPRLGNPRCHRRVYSASPMPSPRHPLLTEGPIGPHLIRMTLPLVWGILATMAAQVVVTWWRRPPRRRRARRHRLRVPGGHDRHQLRDRLFGGHLGRRRPGSRSRRPPRVARLTTDAILISGAITVAIALLGILSIGPLFRALGADATSLPLIALYMKVWYAGAPFYVATMVALSALRAIGDARFQGYAMVAASTLSALLAPVIILSAPKFGINGIAGAAFVGNAPWVITFVVAMFRLGQMEMFERSGFEPAQMARSFRRLMRVGLPAAATNIIIPAPQPS